MAADFPKSTIDVRYATTDYGPYNFDFEDALPSDIELSSVTIRSFAGNVTQDDDLSGETESTSELIDSVKSVINGKYTVDVYFDYPSTAAYIGQSHTLIFEITANNGGIHPFYFYRVKVH